MWRVLLDEDALKFVDFVPRTSMIGRQETPLQVLRRAAQQEDASRWIKRFVFRREYDRALEFAHDVERAVDDLQRGSPQEKKDWARLDAYLYARRSIVLEQVCSDLEGRGFG